MKKHISATELIERIDHFNDSVPLEVQDVEETLKEAGIDADAVLERSLALVRAAKAEALKKSFARAHEERLAALARLEARRSKRSRDENIDRIREIVAMLSPSERAAAFARNFQSAPDEDVESLVEELEALAAEKDGKT